MADFDDFASVILEEGKRFLEKAKELPSDPIAQRAYLHASLLLTFSALEAHVNSIAEEFSHREELTIHELGILNEYDVKLEDGAFISGSLKMYRLEDRVQFLHRRFSGKPLDTAAPWWGAYKAATKLRNKLTHPKEVHAISVKEVETAIEAIIALLNGLYLSIYKKNFPASGWGLNAQLSF